MTNKELKAFIKSQDEILKNSSKRMLRRNCSKVEALINEEIAKEKALISNWIETGKNYHRLNPAHDRVEALEKFKDEVETIDWRGQYFPTYEESVFDAWVD